MFTHRGSRASSDVSGSHVPTHSHAHVHSHSHSQLSRRFRIVAISVIAITLAGLALIRGSIHLHMDDHLVSDGSQDPRYPGGLSNKHLGFHHPDRINSTSVSMRTFTSPASTPSSSSSSSTVPSTLNVAASPSLDTTMARPSASSGTPIGSFMPPSGSSDAPAAAATVAAAAAVRASAEDDVVFSKTEALSKTDSESAVMKSSSGGKDSTAASHSVAEHMDPDFRPGQRAPGLGGVGAGMMVGGERADAVQVQMNGGEGLPEVGSPEWEAHHARIRNAKHEQNKKKRQIEKAAIGAAIAASKVAALTPHLLNGEEGMIQWSQVQQKNGAYKLSGSSSLGGKEARLAAAAYLNATRVHDLEHFDRIVEELRQAGELTADVPNMGPADTGYAVDDNSSCQGLCGRMGFCRQGKCYCAVLYQGEFCQEAREMPEGMHSDFNGNFVFNRKRIRELPELVLKYTTNPKAGGGSHSFTIPVTRDMIKFAPARDPLGARMYETCAIIGSSGILNHYHFGPEIDDSDLIIRFNLAPTKVYKDRVGLRTTLRFVNTVHAGYHEADEIGVMQMQSQVGLQLYLKFRREHPTERVIAFDIDFSKFVSSNVRTLPTGGYFAIWLALARCTKVNIYGFNFASGYGVPHHYFNDEKPKKGKAAIHDYELEHSLIVRLAAANLVRFSEPCVAGCPEKTGIQYPTLAPGGACQCGNGNPLPVAMPGFCRSRESFMCFHKCPGGVQQCPGGVHILADLDGQKVPNDPIDGDGDCPKELYYSSQHASHLDLQDKEVPLPCATFEDVQEVLSKQNSPS